MSTIDDPIDRSGVLQRHGTELRVLFFDDAGNGPIPAGATVGTYAVTYPDLGENGPAARVGIYIEHHGGPFMTADDARQLAAQLVAAADAAEGETNG